MKLTFLTFYIIQTTILTILISYIGWRLIYPMCRDKWGRVGLIFVFIVLFAAFGILCFYPQILGKYSFLSRQVTIFGIAKIFILLVFTIVLLRDLFTFALRIFGRNISGTIKKFLNKVFVHFAVFVCAIVLTFISVCETFKIPEVSNVVVESSELPKDLDGLRMVHLSDTHLGNGFYEPWIKEIVKRTNALNADVVLITGDIVDAPVMVALKDYLPLNDLRAKYGVYTSVGNHEYYVGYHDWIKVFRKNKPKLLLNESETITIGNAKLVIAGTTDSGASRFNLPMPNAEKALSGTPKDNAYIVLMEHRPNDARENAKKGVNLQLSGHTHGGLMTLIQPLVAAFSKGYVSGLYSVSEKTHLYVHNGTGLWAGMPLRLGVPSEITLITLRKK